MTNSGDEIKTEVLYVKNMVCNCARIILREKLEEKGTIVHDITLGKIKITYNTNTFSKTEFIPLLHHYGFDLIDNKEDKIVEDIRIAVIELIHQLNNVNSIVRKSDYIVEKLGFSYQYLSRLFSEHENITLEKYIILQKIERIKHLLDSEEYTLSEIAYMMDYSSVQYLSNQFKHVTGLTVSQYKKSNDRLKTPIDEI